MVASPVSGELTGENLYLSGSGSLGVRGESKNHIGRNSNRRSRKSDSVRASGYVSGYWDEIGQEDRSTAEQHTVVHCDVAVCESEISVGAR